MDGNAAIINFQRSRWNSSESIAFTVNLSVVCGLLLDPDRVSVKTAKEYEGHLRKRIGWFMPDRRDKWWEISCATKAVVISADIANLIVQTAVPYLERHVRTEDLVDLWKSGESPGISEHLRVKYLATLAAAGHS